MPKLPQVHCGDNQEGTLFWWFNIYYARLGSLITTYIYIYIYNICIYILYILPCAISYRTFFWTVSNPVLVRLSINVILYLSPENDKNT